MKGSGHVDKQQVDTIYMVMKSIRNTPREDWNVLVVVMYNVWPIRYAALEVFHPGQEIIFGFCNRGNYDAAHLLKRQEHPCTCHHPVADAHGRLLACKHHISDVRINTSNLRGALLKARRGWLAPSFTVWATVRHVNGLMLRQTVTHGTYTGAMDPDCVDANGNPAPRPKVFGIPDSGRGPGL